MQVARRGKVYKKSADERWSDVKGLKKKDKHGVTEGKWRRFAGPFTRTSLLYQLQSSLSHRMYRKRCHQSWLVRPRMPFGQWIAAKLWEMIEWQQKCEEMQNSNFWKALTSIAIWRRENTFAIEEVEYHLSSQKKAIKMTGKTIVSVVFCLTYVSYSTRS